MKLPLNAPDKVDDEEVFVAIALMGEGVRRAFPIQALHFGKPLVPAEPSAAEASRTGL
ncbi:hypothetical protein [Methylococcus mesophilus]|uniref:hypothetical protein n=1 Tax=Methylococcus mesophilus TaxID=2993564 RepID=UPI00224B477C|nr:hypothetical protein [Methylococcus mesophilus]UZR28857.1 hypothetical protein OOT43_19445 [Methylococcus mesophilus]